MKQNFIEAQWKCAQKIHSSFILFDLLKTQKIKLRLFFFKKESDTSELRQTLKETFSLFKLKVCLKVCL